MSVPLKHKMDARRAAAQCIFDALQSEDAVIWQSLVTILVARLSPAERGCLAWAVLSAARPVDAEAVALAVLGEAGTPVPPFTALWPEAQEWAGFATELERKAYAAACVERMPDATRAAFVRWAQGGAHG